MHSIDLLRSQRRLNDLKNVYAVSETGSTHSDEVLDVLNSINVPLLSWSSQYVRSELIAGYANLKTISRYCSKGKVATHELAEMSGDTDLLRIDPAETEILELSVDLETKI